MMNLITLNPENIDAEHICCAIADRKSGIGVEAKKEWLCSQMSEGLKFKKADIRGKAFIEYIPADNAWIPVDASGYMFINCHWVAGSHKRQGYGKQLMETCEDEAQKMNGVAVIVGKKKKPFLSDKAFFVKHGYEVCDTAEPYFELLVKRFNPKAHLPQFKSAAKQGNIGEGIRGIDIFYTAQCPYTIPYVNLIQSARLASEIPIRTHHIQTKEEAQSHCCPSTNYSVFVNGQFETNKILTPAALKKLLVSRY